MDNPDDWLESNWILEYWGCRTMGISPAGDGRRVAAWRLVDVKHHSGHGRAIRVVCRPGQRHSLQAAILKATKLRDDYQFVIRLRHAGTGETIPADIF